MSTTQFLQSVGSIPAGAGVEKVFGQAQTVGDKTIIPIAEVFYGFGGGMGECSRSSEGQANTGGGGGGGAISRPIGFIEITPGRTQLRLIPDINRIALGTLCVAAMAIWVLGRRR